MTSLSPTEEQLDILNIIKNGTGNVKINAFAGTGKTTTLRMIVEDNPDLKFLYLAFNKAVATEAEKKFPSNCTVSTVHGLAYKNFVLGGNIDRKRFHEKMSKFWKTSIYIKEFKLDRLKDYLPPGEDFYILASNIRNIVNKFKNSDSDKFTLDHIRLGAVYNNIYSAKLKDEMLRKAEEMWEAEQDMNSPVPADHGTYLKMWELTEPVLAGYDVILFDEAQDANPVMLSVIDKVDNMRKVWVGDQNQAIYGWNGAVNAMDRVEVSHDCYLTKSWRFGDAIAAEGNRILDILDPDHKPLTGCSDIPSIKGDIDYEKQFTAIFRTNGAMAAYAIQFMNEGFTVYIEGGVKELCEDLLAVYSIVNGIKYFGPSKYRTYKFKPELMQESKVDITVRRDLAFVEKYRAETPTMLKFLQETILNKRKLKKADIILTTAHKAKGLEFDQVILKNDFKITPRDVEIISVEELNLLYVAVTRAKKVLSVSEEYETFITQLKGRSV